MTAIDALTTRHGRPGSITFETSPLGGPVARYRSVGRTGN